MRRALGLLLGLSLLSGACGWHFQRATAEQGFPYGRWVVKGYAYPLEQSRSAVVGRAEPFLGSEMRVTQDWIDGLPTGGTPCVPGVFRLYRTPLSLLDRFDPRTAGSFSLKDLNWDEAESFEVRNNCAELYLSRDRTRLLWVREGFILSLEPAGRVRFEREPAPEPVRTPTPVIQHLDFEPKRDGWDH
jgi:hypothetical protein